MVAYLKPLMIEQNQVTRYQQFSTCRVLLQFPAVKDEIRLWDTYIRAAELSLLFKDFSTLEILEIGIDGIMDLDLLNVKATKFLTLLKLNLKNALQYGLAALDPLRELRPSLTFSSGTLSHEIQSSTWSGSISSCLVCRRDLRYCLASGIKSSFLNPAKLVAPSKISPHPNCLEQSLKSKRCYLEFLGHFDAKEICVESAFDQECPMFGQKFLQIILRESNVVLNNQLRCLVAAIDYVRRGQLRRKEKFVSGFSGDDGLRQRKEFHKRTNPREVLSSEELGITAIGLTSIQLKFPQRRPLNKGGFHKTISKQSPATYDAFQSQRVHAVKEVGAELGHTDMVLRGKTNNSAVWRSSDVASSSTGDIRFYPFVDDKNSDSRKSLVNQDFSKTSDRNGIIAQSIEDG
ncbi:hypothetical protein C8J56DRAFT_890744 [Mycena floridula]|nr:hypothetical protein C8J56DRAFT_890744 [Mycena floridula]